MMLARKRRAALIGRIERDVRATAAAITEAHGELLCYAEVTGRVTSEKFQYLFHRAVEAHRAHRMAEVLYLVRRGRLARAAALARDSRRRVEEVLRA